jgi:hypothetical protein
VAATLQVLALGTSSGTVHLLDYEGNEVGTLGLLSGSASDNCTLVSIFDVQCIAHPYCWWCELLARPDVQVRQIAAHKAPIHGMSFDDTADHLATCAHDGTVLV